MKKLMLIFGVILITSIGVGNAQTLGTKKNITLKITGYECYDVCDLGLKDIVTGVIYTYDNIDENTKHNGILGAIQELYYKDGESDKKLIGKTYKAIIEYRKVDIWERQMGDEPPRNTGKQENKWMINSLSR